MASTRIQQGQLVSQAKTNGFLDQVTGAVIAYAVGVYTEGAGVSNHTNRLAYARYIAGSPSAAANYMLPGYLANANISAAAGTPASIADADVDTATAAIWNMYSNQYVTNGTIGVGLQFGS